MPSCSRAFQLRGTNCFSRRSSVSEEYKKWQIIYFIFILNSGKRKMWRSGLTKGAKWKVQISWDPFLFYTFWCTQPFYIYSCIYETENTCDMTRSKANKKESLEFKVFNRPRNPPKFFKWSTLCRWFRWYDLKIVENYLKTFKMV